MFNVPASSVTPVMRETAKHRAFASAYSLTRRGVAGVVTGRLTHVGMRNLNWGRCRFLDALTEMGTRREGVVTYGHPEWPSTCTWIAVNEEAER